MLKKNSRIFITGHKGLVGSAIFNKFKLLGYKKIITANKNNLDLRNQRAVNHFFKKNKIDFLIMAAAKAGGILANKNKPTEFLNDNVLIQSNLMMSAHKYNVKRT